MKFKILHWFLLICMIATGIFFTYELLFADDYAAYSSEKTSISFTNEELKLGILPIGIPKEVNISYANTGSSPLVIYDIETSCGCTGVEWNKKPIMPGKSDQLCITYDAKEPGTFFKTITVYGNFLSGSKSIVLKGTVQ